MVDDVDRRTYRDAGPGADREAGAAAHARLRLLHAAALAIVAPTPVGPQAVAALLRAVVERAVTAVGGRDGSLVLADDPAWRDLVPGESAAGQSPAGSARAGQDAPHPLVLSHSGQLERQPVRQGGAREHVLRTGAVVYVPETSLPSPFGRYVDTRPDLGQRQVRSFATLPLAAGGRVLGALSVTFDHPHRLTPDAREALELFAAYAASAIERLRLSHAEQRRTLQAEAARAEAEALAELVASVAGASDPAQTLQTAAAAAARLLRTDSCGIALPGPDGVLRYQYDVGVPEALRREYVFRPGEGYVGRAFVEGRLQGTGDLRGDPASHRPDLDEQVEVRSFLATPLAARGHTLGVLSAGSRRPHAFTERDAALLTTVARHIAVALEGATARQAAQQEAAQKSAILEQMADAVLVADAAGRIVLANAAAARLFGLPVEALAGVTPPDQPWQTLDPTGALVPASERVLSRALRGEDASGEFRLVGADGQERWVSGSATPLRDASGAVRGATVVVRDITGRKAAEERARHMARNEKLRALGQMASGVAHDLNQSLALVAGYGELARRALQNAGQDAGAVSRAIEALDVVSKAALDGGETVARLLAFTRGSAPGEAERVDLATLLQEVARLTSPRWSDAAQSEGRAIELAVSAPPGLEVEGWPAALREALTNLVFNAVDALPRGGAISLEARRQGALAEVCVVDTGTGMTEDVRRRVFEPFFTTKGDRGTGLGLAQVQAAVEQHNGQIAVESAPGRGTTFRLLLPLAAESAAGAPAAPLSAGGAVGGPRPRPGLRVLAVDDEPRLAEMVGLMLAPLGHRVTVAVSAADALLRLEETAYDAVVSDLGLGAGMNGWDLAAQVRQRYPAVRFYLATGWGASIAAEDARAAGVDGVLAKPYRLADLQRLLAKEPPEVSAQTGEPDLSGQPVHASRPSDHLSWSGADHRSS